MAERAACFQCSVGTFLQGAFSVFQIVLDFTVDDPQWSQRVWLCVDISVDFSVSCQKFLLTVVAISRVILSF